MKPRLLAIALVLAAGSVAASSRPGVAGAAEPETAQRAGNGAAANQRWLDRRVTPEERAAFDTMTGHAPPAFPTSLEWIAPRPARPDAPPDAGAPTWESLRGKVVVLQSWTSKTAIGRAMAERTPSLLRSTDPTDVRVLLLHTSEGAENARAYLERTPMPAPVLVDVDGGFGKALGVGRQPVNLVVDRNGAIRYAGLTPEGLTAAVKELTAESFDPSSKPTPMPEPVATKPDNKKESPESAPAPDKKTADSGDTGYPPHNASQLSAENVQGKKAPTMAFGEWVSAPAQTSGKVVVVDCWATWCGPCKATIPHMNELARAFKDSVAVIGVSSENAATIKSFQSNGANPKMEYAVSSDPARAIAGWAKVSGIPHVLVFSPDGVVRWQGHPRELSNSTMQRIVDAAGVGKPAAEPAAPNDGDAKPDKTDDSQRRRPAGERPGGKKPSDSGRPLSPAGRP